MVAALSRAELDRVGEQVGQGLLEPLPLAHDLGHGQVQGHGQAARRDLAGLVFQHRIQERLEGHRPALDRPLLDAGVLQEVVDEIGHPLGRGADPGEELPPRLVEPVRVVLLEGLGEAGHAAQRSLEIVRHGVGEGLELAVGPFELAGALLHPALELHRLPLHLLEQPRLDDRDRELGRHFLRDAHLLVRELPPARPRS